MMIVSNSYNNYDHNIRLVIMNLTNKGFSGSPQDSSSSFSKYLL